MATYTLPTAAKAAVNRGKRKSGMNTKAWAATQKMRVMLPMLERYAQAVLRDPNVRVSITHEASYTDGKNIYIQPPMMLGETRYHSVGNCGLRGEDERQICPACDADEIVMALLYHEISHMLFGSFINPNHVGLKALTTLVAEWHPPNACDHGVDMVQAIAGAKYYMHAAQFFDPRLMVLMNALEDARVNRSMLRARPGTEPMFDARAHHIFTGEADIGNGETKPWPEMPVDVQVVVGMLLAASDYHKHQAAMHPEVQEILADKILVDLAEKIGDSEDMHELTLHTCNVWRRLQELDIIVLDKCTPPPPEDDEPKDNDEPDEDEGLGMPGSEGDGGSSATGDAEDEGDSGGDSGGDSSADPTAGGGSGSSPGPGSSSSQGSNPGKDQQSSNVRDVRDSGNKQEDSGGGDRVEDERDSGGQDDSTSAPEQGGGGDPDEGEPGDGDDKSGDNEGGSGRELTDVEKSEAEGSQPKEGEAGGDDDESADTEPQGATAGNSYGPGEESGDGPGSGGGESIGEGGDEEDPSSEGLRDGGPDDDEELDPADFTPSDLRQLTSAIQAASLHGLFGEDATENFAGGESVLNEESMGDDEAKLWAAALLIAGMQAAWFPGPSEEVGQVHIIQYGENKGIARFNQLGQSRVNLAPPQEIVGPVVTKGRIAFSPNKRNRFENNMKSGKINPRALRKIPLGNEDIFRKKHVAAKRSYHVIITVDVSGSTASRAPSEHYRDQTTLQMMQRAAFAQAEALNRLGISFELWAHTAYYWLSSDEQDAFMAKQKYGSYNENYPAMDIWLLQVKSATEKWDDNARQRMQSLRPLGGNLDGHTLQIMRKKADEASRKFTDVVICYYTDGAMPASNSREEGDILKEETALCKRLGYPLLAIGAGTESPAEWGFDTVRIDSDADLPKVMAQLERHLL